MTGAARLVCLLVSTTAMAGAPSARADQLGWLAGQWRGEGPPSDRIDAVILPPANGGIVGVFRRVRGGQVTTLALASVAEDGGSLVLRTKLFDSDLRGRDAQDAPRRQELVSIKPSEVRFERAWVSGRPEGIEVTAGILHVRMSRVATPVAAVHAGPLHGEPVVRATPGTTPPPARIAAASWMEGDWVGGGLGGTSEEGWMPPLAGTMASVYRGMRDGRVTFFEIVTLVEDGQSLKLRLKHFHPDLSGWEAPERTVDFPLVRTGPGALFLDGMSYRRVPGGLESWVIIGLRDGGTRAEKFLYRARSP